MKITIESTDNGAVVAYDQGDPDTHVSRMVYQFEQDEPERLADMLFDIMESLGVYGGKVAKKMIVLRISHGPDFPCKGCAVCTDGDAG